MFSYQFWTGIRNDSPPTRCRNVKLHLSLGFMHLHMLVSKCAYIPSVYFSNVLRCVLVTLKYSLKVCCFNSSSLWNERNAPDSCLFLMHDQTILFFILMHLFSSSLSSNRAIKPAWTAMGDVQNEINEKREICKITSCVT